MLSWFVHLFRIATSLFLTGSLLERLDRNVEVFRLLLFKMLQLPISILALLFMALFHYNNFGHIFLICFEQEFIKYWIVYLLEIVGQD